jgi:hypothetical protein
MGRVAQSVCFLLQLALRLFDQIEVFLDHFGGFVREVLHVGITPVVCDEKDLAEFQEEGS